MQNLEYQQTWGDFGLTNCHWFTETFPSSYSSQISVSSKVTFHLPGLLRWKWSRQESPQGMKSNRFLAVDAGQIWQQLLLDWKENTEPTLSLMSPTHCTALSLQNFPTQPRHHRAVEFQISCWWNWTVHQETDSDPSVQVWPQLWEIYKELCSLCLALILSPRWSPVGWNTLRLTSLEFLLLLSSRNCCRVTTSLPGEPVLVCLPQLSGVLCWSTGLDLVWPFRYWMGLLLLLDQASCSWSRLNSPLLWLWGLLWLFTAPASGGRQSVFPLEIHQRAVNLQNPTPIRNATRFS